jgi:hypothetical protein
VIFVVEKLTFGPSKLMDRNWSKRMQDWISEEWEPGTLPIVFASDKRYAKRFFYPFKLVESLRKGEEVNIRESHEGEAFIEAPLREGVTMTVSSRVTALRPKWTVSL